MAGDLRIIGVDESGKGDFFGPLVIAAFLAPRKAETHLAEMGVRDSKRISDNVILKLDERLRAVYPYAVIIYTPGDYNRVYDEIRNLNKLLAQGHARAICAILEKSEGESIPLADKAISDKFGKRELIVDELRRRGQTIELETKVRGESVPQVAAASIIARAAFVRQIDELSQRFGCEIPKGAAPQVDKAGREIVKRHGVEALSELAKLHFKNYKRVVTTDFFK